jgi:sporulation protein YlmC with PRC-barrel domain
MLRSLEDLENYAIHATDGDIGHVRDFFFDDHAWVIRYLVVETGTWMSSRKVLISPVSIGAPNWDERLLPVSITRAQVRNSPEIDTDKPVSRQHEMNYLGYYGYPYYWGGAGFWGMGAYPGMMLTGLGGRAATPDRYESEPGVALARREAEDRLDEDPHLRSAKAVMRYHVHAADGEIGHVQGVLVDEKTWAIRYLVVNTSNWWLGHLVLISPEWVDEVRWLDATVSVDLTREAVRESPLYDSTATLNRELEEKIYGHYGRTGYWSDAGSGSGQMLPVAEPRAPTPID